MSTGQKNLCILLVAVLTHPVSCCNSRTVPSPQHANTHNIYHTVTAYFSPETTTTIIIIIIILLLLLLMGRLKLEHKNLLGLQKFQFSLKMPNLM
jgi:hypothetical protein